MSRLGSAVVSSLCALALMAGCASGDSDGADDAADAVVIVTDIYPTTFAVEQVVGAEVQVVQLAPAGVEPHGYELTLQQVEQVAKADLVAFLPDMVPAVQDAVEQEAADKSVDVSQGINRLEESEPNEVRAEGEEHAGEAWDPHVWLDPKNVAVMGANVAAALKNVGIDADPSRLKSDMAALDGELTAALTKCAITTMVVNHEAFGYLAKAYGFAQVGISGLSPEEEPSPAKLAEITGLVEKERITTIYFETLASSAAAEVIAQETGASTALLDPIEGNTEDAGYPAIMRANSQALHLGQSCS